MAGIFSPTIWIDGEDADSIPTADDLNLEWHDAFDFLLNSRPMILVHHTTSAVTVPLSPTYIAIPMDTELLKRGGMTHSTVTNNSRITVPITGQYSGYAQLGIGTVTTLSSGHIIAIRKNGSTILTQAGKMAPVILGDNEFNSTFTLDLTAGDYIEFVASAFGSTALTGTDALKRCKMALWYVGDNA